MNYDKGQKVFLEDGQAGTYVEQLTDGHHLIETITFAWDEDEETYLEYMSGTYRTASKVFTKAPTEKFDDDVARLKQEIKQLTDDKRQASSEAYKAKRERDETIKALDKHGVLEDLRLWLDGKVTHVVSARSDSVEIFSPADRKIESLAFITTSERRSSREEFKWAISRRGSYGAYNVGGTLSLHASLDDAKSHAQKHIDSIEKPHRSVRFSPDHIRNCCKEYDLIEPDWVGDLIKKEQEAAIEAKRKKLLAEQVKLEKQVEEAGL